MRKVQGLLQETAESAEDDTVGVRETAAVVRARRQGRVFECRTCGRRFPTYQALGGHRASHGRHLPSASRPRAYAPGHDVALQLRLLEPRGGTARPRTHRCPVCGVEFAVGQALGGHMKRHRGMADADAHATREAASVKADGAGAECTAEICLGLNLAQAENCAKCRNAGASGEAQRPLLGGNS